MNIDRLLNFVSNAGKIMLESGGEIYRVEETISIICKSFDIEEANCFASPTVVIVSIFIEGKIHTAVKRISTRGVNLNKVHKINSLSREIYNDRPSIDYCENKLKEIDKNDSYSFISTLFFAGISTSAFTILFGGGINDFICAFIIGILVKFISVVLCNTNLNDFFINCLCGTVITIAAMIFLKLNIISQIDKLIAGSIMLLVPGLLLTNSLRDILEGQLVSGLTKAGEALFIGVSTAAGTFFALHIFMLLGGL